MDYCELQARNTIFSKRDELIVLDLSALVIFLAFKNTRSTGALVAGKRRNILLTFARDGNRD